MLTTREVSIKELEESKQWAALRQVYSFRLSGMLVNPVVTEFTFTCDLCGKSEKFIQVGSAYIEPNCVLDEARIINTIAQSDDPYAKEQAYARLGYQEAMSKNLVFERPTGSDDWDIKLDGTVHCGDCGAELEVKQWIAEKVKHEETATVSVAGRYCGPDCSYLCILEAEGDCEAVCTCSKYKASLDVSIKWKYISPVYRAEQCQDCYKAE